MFRTMLVTLALALPVLTGSGASAMDGDGGLYSPTDNPNGVEAPEQFFAQQYGRRQALGCFKPHDCGAVGSAPRTRPATGTLRKRSNLTRPQTSLR